MVGQGEHPSAKRFPTTSHSLFHGARTGLGPGVRVSGAAPRRNESDHHGMIVAAVRHGTDPVAVPL